MQTRVQPKGQRCLQHIEQTRQAVCRQLNINPADLMAGKKGRNITIARCALLAWLLSQHPATTYRNAARSIGITSVGSVAYLRNQKTPELEATSRTFTALIKTLNA